MPQYILPPWLHPQDITGAYVQGQRMRAEADMQQQRLAQQQQLAAMEMQVKKEQADREALLQQQRLAVESQMKQQELSLHQQALAQDQQKIQAATEAAARKYQAMQAYQQELQGGGDPLQAILKYGPAMGQQASAEAAAIRASLQKGRGAVEPTFGTDVVSGSRYVYNPATGATHIIPQTKPEGLSERDILQAKLRRYSELSKQLPPSWQRAALTPEMKANVDKTQSAVDQLDQQIKDMLENTAKQRPAGSKRFRYDPSSKSLMPIGAPSDQAPSDEELDTLEGEQQ